MAKQIAPSPELLAALERVTSVSTRDVERVVIVISARDPIRVYVQAYGDAQEISGLLETFADGEIEIRTATREGQENV